MNIAKGFSICGISKCKKQFNNIKAWKNHVRNKHKIHYRNNKKYYDHRHSLDSLVKSEK